VNPHQVFIEEARDLLDQLQRGLAAAEQDPEAVHAIFRAAHTLKGAAGVFGFDAIVHFAHGAETLLEVIRAGEHAMTPQAVALLLEAHDELARLVDLVDAGEPLTAGSTRVADALLALAGVATTKDSSAPPAPPAATKSWLVRVEFGPTVLTDGFDPVAFFRYLERLGAVSQRATDLSRLPVGDAFDPECCYLTVSAHLDTAADQATIEKVFEFVRDGSVVSVALAHDGAAAPVHGPRTTAHERPSVKVPADRLDLLIDLVGELVIAGATSSVHAARSGHVPTGEAVQALNGLIASIRDAALGLRMVAIGETFNRFGRVVRDLSRQLGKEVELEILGGDTELDKAVVERLVDPLTHVVRNSLDHGLETVAERQATGKPPTGKLTLSASHEGGSILIEVRDDGRGLNRKRILARAVERGLVEAGARPTESEIDDIIFLPGFSLAEQVTDLSGRGVGMDVVRSTVEELRGTIELRSTEGHGTTIKLRLPLTLAIIDGFVVSSADDTCILPLKAVVECLDFATVVESEAHHRLKVRDAPVPFVRLRELFKRGGERPGRENVVVVQHGEQRVGIVVDRLLGASQTVIKPLGPLFQKVEGVAGATVLGSGDVGFILDVGQVLRLATAARGHA
jgi:two-component system chemotaxis sensor kinase CheA